MSAEQMLIRLLSMFYHSRDWYETGLSWMYIEDITVGMKDAELEKALIEFATEHGIERCIP